MGDHPFVPNIFDPYDELVVHLPSSFDHPAWYYWNCCPFSFPQTLEEQIDRYMYEIVDKTDETLGEIGIPLKGKAMKINSDLLWWLHTSYVCSDLRIAAPEAHTTPRHHI